MFKEDFFNPDPYPFNLPRYNLTAAELLGLERWARSASLSSLARLVVRTWPRPATGARPFLVAMSRHTEPARVCYGQNSGRGVVLHFLAASGRYRGPVSTIVLSELRRRCV